MTMLGSEIDAFPPLTTLRRRALAKATRRLVSSLLHARWRQATVLDDRSNLRDLLLAPKSSLATCPLCSYSGPFLTFAGRRRELCLRCGSKARHRALAVAFDHWRDGSWPIWRDGLHLAPEPCLRPLLGRLCEQWLTADLEPLASTLSLGLDLTRAPFADASFDIVVANHVLEHIVDDRRAIAEVRRILKPGGVAVLVVPLVVESTVDFGTARSDYNDHARDCGNDYVERYRDAGFEVEVIEAEALPEAREHSLVSTSGPGALHHIPFCVRPSGDRP